MWGTRLSDLKIGSDLIFDAINSVNTNNTTDYTPEQVMHYWFQGAERDIETLRARSKIWYSFSAEWDAEIKDKFSKLLHEIANGLRRDWEKTSSGVLALVLVLDQFTRHIYRKTAAAFAYDAQALATAYAAINCALDQKMSVPGRLFLYHPFQHSEKLLDQEFGVQIVQDLQNQCEQQWYEYVAESLRFFQEHCEIVRRFGRFPHRNDVLKRISTPNEIEFLRTASSYGQ